MNFFLGMVTAWGLFLIYDYFRKEVRKIQNDEMLGEIEISITAELREAYKILQDFIKIANQVDERTSNEKLPEYLESAQNYTAHENSYFSQILGMAQTVLIEYIQRIISDDIQPNLDDPNCVFEITYAITFRTIITAAHDELTKYHGE